MLALNRDFTKLIPIPAKAQKIFFCGIGGVGMNPLAHLMHLKGKVVSGSDCQRSDNIVALQKNNVKCFIGHQAQNIDAVDVFVFSSAIDVSNPELIQAQKNACLLVHRSDVLADIFNDKKSISIAGTHGKTTVSGLTAMILAEANLEPTAVVGGYVPAFEGYYRAGSSDWIVAESDESDGSFQKLNSSIAVILNIDRDHLDYYQDLDSIIEAFKVYISNIKTNGSLIYNLDDPNTEWISASLRPDIKSITCGIDSCADYQAQDIKYEAWKTSFVVAFENKKIEVVLAVPGRHNVINCLHAIATAREAGAGIEAIQSACLAFHGVGRRFELLGKYKGALVVDDYAHHPKEIAATFNAAKAMNKKILTVFQPHRYSRTEKLIDEFVTELGKIDNLIITDIYSASEKQTEMTGQRLYQLLRTKNPKVKYVNELELLPRAIADQISEGDLILCMGAGSISKVAHKLVKK